MFNGMIKIDERIVRFEREGPDLARPKPRLECQRPHRGLDQVRVLCHQAAEAADLQANFKAGAMVILLLSYMKRLSGSTRPGAYLPRGYSRCIQEELEQRFGYRPSGGLIRWFDGKLRSDPRLFENLWPWLPFDMTEWS